MIGIDTSADMLRQARERLPAQKFVEANISHWAPPERTDVLFANAIFQWVPGHLKQLQRLLGALPSGGVLAVQMPDNLDEPVHVLLREIAKTGAVAARQLAEKARGARHPADARRLLRRAGALSTRLEIWHTIYNHVLEDAAAVVEWVKGTGLRPFVDPLEPPERKQYVAEYTKRIAEAYRPQADHRSERGLGALAGPLHEARRERRSAGMTWSSAAARQPRSRPCRSSLPPVRARDGRAPRVWWARAAGGAFGCDGGSDRRYRLRDRRLHRRRARRSGAGHLGRAPFPVGGRAAGAGQVPGDSRVRKENCCLWRPGHHRTASGPAGRHDPGRRSGPAQRGRHRAAARAAAPARRR